MNVIEPAKSIVPIQSIRDIEAFVSNFSYGTRIRNAMTTKTIADTGDSCKKSIASCDLQ